MLAAAIETANLAHRLEELDDALNLGIIDPKKAILRGGLPSPPRATLARMARLDLFSDRDKLGISAATLATAKKSARDDAMPSSRLAG